MIKVTLKEEIRTVAPRFIGAYLEAEVRNCPTPSALWEEIRKAAEDLRDKYDTETIKARPGISATRNAYKAAGKDPSRYRPSCEQLARRILQGKELYSIDLLVDLGNLISLVSGYSVGVIDRDKVEGDTIELGIGCEGEPYEGIGRGPLNIASMPVYRDDRGAFATPTSDSVRTMCSATTRHVLIIINGYDGDTAAVEAAANRASRLLREYGESDGGMVQLIGG
ncbi:MAG: hypothetical protein IJ722_01970 [Alloprevotella sp.]|nr:hypothetical protein [Alloprevotella sp.]